MDWSYIAGFTDGEGNICLTSNHRYGCSPRITLAQSGQIGIKVLTNIKNWLAPYGIECCFSSEEPKKLSKLPTHRLIISNRNSATIFLSNVLPYLITKKLAAEDVLRHLKIFPALPRGGFLCWEGRKRNRHLC